MDFVLQVLFVHPYFFYILFFPPAPFQKLLLVLLLHFLCKSTVLPHFQRIQNLTKNFQSHISIKSISQGMKQEIQRFLSNLKVIILIKLLQISQTKNSHSPTVQMLKRLPRLNTYNFSSTLLDNSEPFQQLNNYFEKRCFNLGIENPLKMVERRWLLKLIKRRQLTNKICPRNEPVSFGIELLVNLVKLPVTTRNSVSKIPSKLRNHNFLIALW